MNTSVRIVILSAPFMAISQHGVAQAAFLDGAYGNNDGGVAIEEGKAQTREGHCRFARRTPGAAVNRTLSTWKELTAPRPVERSGIPASGV